MSETVSEGTNQIVFMKNVEDVYYLYGYPENNDFGIFFNNGGSIADSSIFYAVNHNLF